MTDTSKAINPDPTGKVTLREITADTLESILNLSVSEDQERFVASNAHPSPLQRARLVPGHLR